MMFADSTEGSKASIPTQNHPHFNRSNNMQQVLQGTPEVNRSYFVDSLERFSKDFASHDKQEREIFREKMNNLVAQRQQEYIERKQQNAVHEMEEEFKRTYKNSQQTELWETGIRKNGSTTGLPVNPVTNQYERGIRGQQFQRQESEKRLNFMLRQHHLQTKGNCGYNPINGKENPPVHSQIPEYLFPGMDSRIREYQQHYTLRPPEL